MRFDKREITEKQEEDIRKQKNSFVAAIDLIIEKSKMNFKKNKLRN